MLNKNNKIIKNKTRVIFSDHNDISKGLPCLNTVTQNESPSLNNNNRSPSLNKDERSPCLIINCSINTKYKSGKNIDNFQIINDRRFPQSFVSSIGESADDNKLCSQNYYYHSPCI